MAIVCGTDLTPRAEPGIAAAAALASRLQRELVLVHAAAGEPSGAIRARLQAQAPRTGRVRCVIEQGDAPAVLIREAERTGALIVVSCTGHRDKPLLRVGGVAERIAEKARVPTLVVQSAAPFEEWAAGRRPLRVVLGLGHAEADGAAVEWVAGLRGAGPCDVAAVTIYDPVDAAHHYGLARQGSVLDSDPRVERLIEGDMEIALAKLGGEGRLTSRAVPGLGRAGDHLLEFAAAQEADLVVVGAHRKGWLARLGSVSSVALHWRQTSVACIPARQRR